MLEKLKQLVYEANLELPKKGLITYTWGNASGFDKESGLLVIKPSGIEYENMKAEDMVVMDLHGNKIEGKYSPSSDTPTHIELYKEYPEIGGIVHTHSTYATSWAQAGREVPIYGTTHADYFFGPILCARSLAAEEIQDEYEKNTGLVIIEKIKNTNTNVLHNPGILCTNHGVFTWGKNALEAVHNAVVIEEVAKMACLTENINKDAKQAPENLVNKHFLRKHGDNAYYGQKAN